MINLLRANFYRLKKSKCFYLLMGIMFLYGIYLYANYNSFDGSYILGRDEVGETAFLGFPAGIFFLLPIFTCLFVGTEYSDGIIKNKIIGGHKRINIYLANLLTNFLVCLLMCLSFIISISIMEIVMVSDIRMSLNKFIFLVLDEVLLSLVIASIYNFTTMLTCNKTSSAIISFAIVIWSLIISNTLYHNFKVASVPLKYFYQFLVLIFPYNHFLLITSLTNQYYLLGITSIILLIVINFYGIIYFKNKEIK